MAKTTPLFVFCVLCFFTVAGLGEETSRVSGLLRYETLSLDSQISQLAESQQLRFDAYERTFSVIFDVDREIFAPTAKVYVHGENGEVEEETEVHSHLHVFKGHLENQQNAIARASLKGKDFQCVILLGNETYHLESAPHFGLEGHDFDTIIYRDIDSVMPNNTQVEMHGPELSEQDLENEPHARGKRAGPASSAHYVCDVALHADSTFYNQWGGSNSAVTQKMSSIVQQADAIYANNLPGKARVQIARVHIWKGWTKSTSNSQVYLTESKKYLVSQQPAGSTNGYDKVCLNHFFTHQTFSGGTLGVAYIASPQANYVGGICSFSTYSGGGWNFGYSTTSSYGSALPASSSARVAAHELGHNFGSPHDPIGSSCDPSGNNNFLMYPSLNTYSNGDDFSSCSKNSINQVISVKGSCFKIFSGSGTCGNGVVEPGEACDGGPCCTSSCSLKSGAQCDSTDPCCTSTCRYASSSQVCRAVNGPCDLAETCTGSSSSCPSDRKKSTGSSCSTAGVSGECLANGQCSSREIACRTPPITQYWGSGWSHCSWQSDSDCRIACSKSGSCSTFRLNDATVYYPNGTPCGGGKTCNNGSCR